ncbi:Autoinducer binding domain-containing protein [Pseudonocardia thermophila]|jgi:Response regulator containing a CheY-like receiver domain and an HTH DNA-binding domain|uniref:Autoinducer binding domain-containing protein n=1 Tax=Pseudonocardia thermophila TaxID=1848 RepID=A0A1M6UHK3_PSETH|nr:LuxR C-terminal-related transcriptional regulator [Pseudonocardia thermophila]SHK68633.1 Autoinducer binding domain-containing protein [Pseudonocardia thermophila]
MSAVTAARELRSLLRRHGSRTPGSAAAALDALTAVVPADCVSLSAWDPVKGKHRTLASSYPSTFTGFFDEEMQYDPLFVEVRANREPTRIEDIDPPRRHGPIFERVIHAGGFRDGLTYCLFAPDGRYVGMLNASAERGGTFDEDVVGLLDLLGSDFGAALDPVESTGAPTSRLHDGVTQGFLVRPDGARHPLTPGARPDLVDAAPALAAAVRRVGRGEPAEHLHLVERDTVHAVEVYASGRDVVVLHRRVPPPSGLSVREMQVLAGLAHGLTNPEIGEQYGIGARTVATHVEHVLAKTGCRNRVEAACHGARLGIALCR